MEAERLNSPSPPNWPTSPSVWLSCGGIFDYDAQSPQAQRSQVSALEDPKVWDNPKRAQELGKEKRVLENVVAGDRPPHYAELSDNTELFDMSRRPTMMKPGIITIEGRNRQAGR
jgi:peptide chain release factor 2